MIKKEDITKIEHNFYYRRMFYVVIILLFILFSGVIFYHNIEKWRYIDALYFSSYTITTIGYGDFVPKTDIGKLFTVFYAFMGIGIALYGVSLFASYFIESREEFWINKIEDIGKRSRLRINHHKNSFFRILKKIIRK